MKWIGQHIWDFISRFRSDVYMENLAEVEHEFSVMVGPDGKLTKSTHPGERSRIQVRNDEGVTIPAGAPIYSKGEVGGSETIKVGICDSSDPAKMPCIGIVETELNTTDNKDGFATTQGVYNTNISGFTGLSEGDILYVNGGSAPHLTQTKPTSGDLIQNVGVVIKTNGTICQGLLVAAIGRTNDVPWPLYVDHTNQRVGIGTSSPAKKLTVTTSTTGDGILGISTDGNDWFRVQNDNSTAFPVGTLRLYYGTNQNVKITALSNEMKLGDSQNNMTFFTASLERMRLTNTGQLGIGTTSPDAILHIKDVNPRIIKLQDANYTNQYATIGFDDGHIRLSSDPDNQRANSIIAFSIDNSNKMLLDSSGRLGIGTTSPSQLIDVASSGTNTNAPTFRITNTANNSASNWNGKISHAIEFYSTDPSRVGLASSIQNIAGTDKGGVLTGNITFNTADWPTGGIHERMRITDSGNVGINQVNPTEKLHVVGNVRISEVLYISSLNQLLRVNNNEFEINNYSSDKPILFKTSDGGSIGERMRLTSGGNLLIGTTTDSGEKLVVDGDIKINDNTIKIGINNDLLIYHDGSNSYIKEVGTGTLRLQTNGAGIDFYKNSTEFLARLITDGAVELYYDSVKKFETTSSGISITGGGIFTDQVTIPATPIASTDAASKGYVDAQIGANNDLQEITDNGATTTNDMTISNGAPAMILKDSTSGSSTVIARNSFRNNVNTEVGTVGFLGDGDLRLTNVLSNNITFYTSNAEKMRLTSSGNVLIGTTTDDGSSKLQVNGNVKLNDNFLYIGTGNDFYIRHDGSNTTIYNSTGHLGIYNAADDKDIIFYCDDTSGGVTEYFRVDGGTGVTEFSRGLRMADSQYLTIGTGSDLLLYHNGTNNFIQNGNGDLYIKQTANDKDIIFQSDDGSGGVADYIIIDGSQTRTNIHKNLRFDDIVRAEFGNSGDLVIIHDGTDSRIENGSSAGDLKIQNAADDKDILFRCDNGAGGVTNYFRLDGSAKQTLFEENVRFLDNIELRLGSGSDMKMFHLSNQGYIQNQTGHLNIQQYADDSDIIFSSDDGSGGTQAYMTIDGSDADVKVHTNIELERALTLQHASDPGDPASGHSVIWSDTSGNLKIKINVAGTTVTKTITTYE